MSSVPFKISPPVCSFFAICTPVGLLCEGNDIPLEVLWGRQVQREIENEIRPLSRARLKAFQRLQRHPRRPGTATTRCRTPPRARHLRLRDPALPTIGADDDGALRRSGQEKLGWINLKFRTGVQISSDAETDTSPSESIQECSSRVQSLSSPEVFTSLTSCLLSVHACGLEMGSFTIKRRLEGLPTVLWSSLRSQRTGEDSDALTIRGSSTLRHETFMSGGSLK